MQNFFEHIIKLFHHILKGVLGGIDSLINQNSSNECDILFFDKEEFRGRKALIRQRQARTQRRLVRLEVSDNETFDARGQEPVRTQEGELVGRTTSGGFGHCLSKSLAMAYLSSVAIEAGSELEIKLMNDWFPASIFELEDRI